MTTISALETGHHTRTTGLTTLARALRRHPHQPTSPTTAQSRQAPDSALRDHLGAARRGKTSSTRRCRNDGTGVSGTCCSHCRIISDALIWALPSVFLIIRSSYQLNHTIKITEPPVTELARYQGECITTAWFAAT